MLPVMRGMRSFLAVVAVSALALVAAGCSSSGPAKSSAKPVKGGTVTDALAAGQVPNYIFPFVSLGYFSVIDLQGFQYLMYRPLYWYGGDNTSPTIDYGLSAAKAPVYTNGGKTVVINLKGWKWSNGETVDAKDVIFWLHMMYAEFSNWAGAVPGAIPYNTTSIAATGPEQVTMHLKQAYSSIWYTYNELSQITPMPMSWDVTKAGAAPGSGGCTADSAADHWAKCKAVYKFLTSQAKATSSYASSPIWSVVDGPWKLQTFATNGRDTFVPNPKYSGSPKPRIAALKYLPYTSDTAEYTALKTGGVDIGYIPSADLPSKPVSQLLPSTNPVPNYALKPAYTWGYYYYDLNYNNPVYGPAFKQLYFRQALEYVDDQTGMAKSIYSGYGFPTTGPVPLEPVSKWIPAAEKSPGPYPFSVAKARALLTSHGWSPVNGVMTCEVPAKCGPGVKKGLQAKFTIDYSTGSASFSQEMQIYKSDAARAGIDLTITGQSFNTIIGEDSPCSGAKCTWQAHNYGTWIYVPDYEPTGEDTFLTGAGSNVYGYSNPTMDSLIKATLTSSSLSTFLNFASYCAKQLPVIWMPSSYTIEAVPKNLHGVAFNPLGSFLPEYYYFTK